MPLFNPATYATTLAVTNPSNEYTYLQGFLMFLENYLLNQYGLSFSDIPSTKSIQDFQDGVSIIPLNFVRTITNVEVKSYTDSSYSQVLTANPDYILSSVRTSPKPHYQIRLLSRELCLPQYIEITGKWSFADSLPTDIAGGVLEILQLGLANFRYNKNLMDKSGKVVSKTKMKNVEVTFGSGSTNRDVSYDSLFSSSLLKMILDVSYKYD